MTPLSSHRATISVLACLGFLLILPTQTWSQVDASAQEADSGTVEEAPLEAPPPVSGSAYDTDFTTETESNYLRGGLTIAGAYSNNVAGSASNPIGGPSYSLWPTITFDKTTIRGHYLVNYSPGFTFYPHTSALNQGNQNVAADLRYRLSPNVTVSLVESLQKTSNIFNQPTPLSTTVVSGSAPTPVQAVVPPVDNQLSNSANAQLTYQLDASSMVGAAGTFASLHFSNPVEAAGLSNSSSVAGSAFYSRRLLDKYSVGANYQFQNIDSTEPGTQSLTNTHTQTQTIFFFLSILLKPTLSLSLSVGPQYFTSSQGQLPTVASWSPLMMASVGWQGARTSLAASYSRMATAAAGLNGVFQSNSVNVSARWQMARTWIGGLAGSYGLYRTLTPSFVLTSSGGDTVTGTASVEHTVGEHLRAGIGYSWVKQSYSGSTAISNYPNTSRAYISISYTFSRPLQ